MENKLMADPPFEGHLFGALPDGRPVHTYAIGARNGIEMHVMNYGATITAIRVPSLAGMIDVALGFDTLEGYLESKSLPAPPYFGAIAGRYAGRISGGQFMLGERHFKLSSNDNGNTLHGGHRGFDAVLWTVTHCDEHQIRLQYKSPEGEEGFPGEALVTVTYTVDQNRIRIDYEATCSEDSPLNLTQHTYFNLDGHQGDIRSQELWINARKILETDSFHIPTGQLIPAADKNMDFSFGGTPFFGIDDDFIPDDISSPVATFTSRSSDLRLTVMSSLPSLHVYVGGNLFGQLSGKHGNAYHQYSGICFESQLYPDAPNQPHFPSGILKKGDVYRHHTLWTFENLSL